MVNLEDALRRFPLGDLAGPASEQAIADAEAKLGVTFPADYREFLSKCGAAVGSGFSLAGIATRQDPETTPYWEDVVDSTLQLRRASGSKLPGTYVFLADDGGDFKFFIDLSDSRHAETSRVVALGPGVDAAVVAESFVEFVDRISSDSFSF